MELIAIALFVVVFIVILRGYPVSFTLGGLSILVGIGLWIYDPDYFNWLDFKLIANRINGTINNFVLIAIPLFIYMGVMLEKSGLAKSLLETMALLFGKMRGGLALSVIIVGALLAASTGIVGATVVTMGLISLPAMLQRGYDPSIATGTIATSGTLGVIIPPSIMLVLLADTINSSNRGEQSVDVGSMFAAALVPGLILVVAYVGYIIYVAWKSPEKVPIHVSDDQEEISKPELVKRTVLAFILPFFLIIAVLGSIFLGIASPTEAAAVGALGATLLTLANGKLTLNVLDKVGRETTKITAMVFFILLGATTFTLMFRHLGGDEMLVNLVSQSRLSMYGLLLLVMLVLFIVGFFIDFIEIIFIFIPVITPLFNAYDADMLWVGILIALNLQISFLTPPFGFSLFYLKGVAPPEISTQQIYKGVIPYIGIQVLLIVIVIMFPRIIYLFS